MRALLLSLAGLTLGATAFQGVALAPPAPQRLAPERLALPGYQVKPMGSSPARGDRDLRMGTLRRWKLQALAGGAPLQLSLLPMRSRNSDGMQLAGFARLEPSLAMLERRLSVAESSRYAVPPADQVAFGRGPADPPGSLTRLQSCLTPGNRSGVGEITLGLQLGAEREAELKRNRLGTRLLWISGLQPNARWECLAVQLSTPPGLDSEQRLQEAWRAVREQLESTGRSVP
jgi:hypothetical protein